MPRITKKHLTLAANVCSAGACETLHRNGIVFIAELGEPMLANEGLDLYAADLVMVIAAATFRDSDSGEESDSVLRWAEMYAEAAARLYGGFVPDVDI